MKFVSQKVENYDILKYDIRTYQKRNFGRMVKVKWIVRINF